VGLRGRDRGLGFKCRGKGIGKKSKSIIWLHEGLLLCAGGSPAREEEGRPSSGNGEAKFSESTVQALRASRLRKDCQASAAEALGQVTPPPTHTRLYHKIYFQICYTSYILLQKK